MLIQKLQISPQTSLSLWKIDEDENTLQSLIKQQLSEKNYTLFNELLQSISNANRRKEKLCTYLLLGLDTLILYEENGKPYIIVDSDRINLSISHTTNYVALAANSTEQIGIDIEIISNRVERIATKFLSEKELLLIQTKKDLYYTLFWCIKEALYKWYGLGELDFIENIQIIDNELNTKLILKDKNYSFQANYNIVKIENHSLLVVWCIK